MCLLYILWSGSPALADEPRLLVFGDSLSAAYSIPLEASWPALLQQRLEAHGHPHRVINASISGETSGGGLQRLPAALERHNPDWLLLQLGANDGLRGQSPEAIYKNLRQMVVLAQQSGAQVVLLGILLPPNYGPLYQERFHTVYRRLASEYDLPLLPFLLEGVALDPTLMQDDGLHPTAAAQPRILDNVWEVLEPLLQHCKRAVQQASQQALC